MKRKPYRLRTNRLRLETVAQDSQKLARPKGTADTKTTTGRVTVGIDGNGEAEVAHVAHMAPEETLAYHRATVAARPHQPEGNVSEHNLSSKSVAQKTEDNKVPSAESEWHPSSSTRDRRNDYSVYVAEDEDSSDMHDLRANLENATGPPSAGSYRRKSWLERGTSSDIVARRETFSISQTDNHVYGNTEVKGQGTAILGNVHVKHATFLLASTSIATEEKRRRRVERHNTIFADYTLETTTSFDDGPDAVRRGAAQQTRSKWERKEDLGAGIFGEVHREECLEDALVRSRAVKVLRLRQLKRLKVDYMKEIGALIQLSHPKYVHRFIEFYSWYEDADNIYLAMEYIRYGDLTAYIGNGMKEIDAKKISYQVLDGLQIMHRLDIIHRDIKPGNIFVVRRAPEWWVKIGDFSICKSTVTQHTTLHTSVGTSGYQAPEVLGFVNMDGPKHYNAKCDVWSFGCMLYEMLTGKLPFPYPHDLVLYCQDSALPIRRLHDSGLSSDGIEFLKMVLEATPGLRPTSADALENGEKILWFDWPKTAERSHTVPSPTPNVAPKLGPVPASEVDSPSTGTVDNIVGNASDTKQYSEEREHIVREDSSKSVRAYQLRPGSRSSLEANAPHSRRPSLEVSRPDEPLLPTPNLLSKPEPGQDVAVAPAYAQAIALFTFDADLPGDLAFKKGEIITIIKKTDKATDWWIGKNEAGVQGTFPSNYVDTNFVPPKTKSSRSGKVRGLKRNQVVALFAYDAAHAGDLSFRKGDIITVTGKRPAGGLSIWTSGRLKGVEGLFPSNYVSWEAEPNVEHEAATRIPEPLPLRKPRTDENPGSGKKFFSRLKNALLL